VGRRVLARLAEAVGDLSGLEIRAFADVRPKSLLTGDWMGTRLFCFAIAQLKQKVNLKSGGGRHHMRRDFVAYQIAPSGTMLTFVNIAMNQVGHIIEHQPGPGARTWGIADLWTLEGLRTHKNRLKPI
jgi:hypothetical protein